MPPTRRCTPEGRAAQHPSLFVVVANTLQCKVCSTIVDHRRSSSVKSHLTSGQHRRNAQKGGQVQSVLFAAPPTTSLIRERFNMDVTELLAQAGVPLNRLSLFKAFFRKHCRDGAFLDRRPFFVFF